MDRRFVIWLAISFLLLVMLSPRPKPPEKKQVGEQAAPAEVADGVDGVEGVAAKPQAAGDEGEDSDAAQREPLEAEAEVAVEWHTMGSADPASPYRMLVTATNQGAGIERIELASPRYRDLQDRGGYLGHLQSIVSPDGGLIVNVVGAGTPAAQAGLKSGDRIVAGGTTEPLQPIGTQADLNRLLAEAKPKSKFTMEVRRGVETRRFDATLTRRPLEVIRPESENVLLWAKSLPPGFIEPPSFLMTLHQVGEQSLLTGAPGIDELPDVSLTGAAWRIVESSQDMVAFRRRVPEYGLQVVKRFRIAAGQRDDAESVEGEAEPAYDLMLDVEIENLGNQPQKVAYRLDGPNGLPIEGWWYANKVGHTWGSVGIRDVLVRPFGAAIQQFAPVEIAEGDAQAVEGAPLAYLGVDAQYFSAMLIPQKKSAESMWLERTELKSLSPPPTARSAEGRYANVTNRMFSFPHELPPGGKLQHTYQIFAGPKRPELLSQYEAPSAPAYALDDLVTYGWFTTIAKGMLSILHFFYNVTGNYGVAIIMLTVLVRSCMFPISRKQAISMMKMQELRPDMERIKEKYKTDMQKQSQAMQELYRKHGVNPLAGCLPMLIQLPVFIGLYRSLAVDIELRQAPLFGESIRWCSNLAAPDMFLDWSGIMPEFVNRGEGILSLGPYLNVLPLVTIALFLLQQKMFMPEPTNEQAALQQKIMKYMMVFMGLLFYKVPSGLCLYFIASSTWGIAERKLLPKPSVDAASPSDTPPARKEPKGASDKPQSSTRPGKNGADASKKRKKSKRRK